MPPETFTTENSMQKKFSFHTPSVASSHTREYQQFCNAADLNAWCHREIKEWYSQANQAEGKKPSSCDQEHSETLIHFKPPRPVLSPLILLGGMGPLAGLRGLKTTITQIQHKREIIFYQACLLPCRSQAIHAELAGDYTLSQSMVRQLSAAIDYAIGYIQTPHGSSLLLLCNTVHYFLPEIQRQLDKKSIRVVSLIDAGFEAVKHHGGKHPILLASPGTYMSGLYNQFSGQHNVTFIEPNATGKIYLSRAIFDGIKGGNTYAAIKWGEALFRHLPYTNSTSILAACTEVPEFIELLKKYASLDLRHYLSQLNIINPVQVATEKLS